MQSYGQIGSNRFTHTATFGFLFSTTAVDFLLAAFKISSVKWLNPSNFGVPVVVLVGAEVVPSSFTGLVGLVKVKDNFKPDSIKSVKWLDPLVNPLISQMNFPTLTVGRAISNFRGVGCCFFFYSNSNRTFCEQTVETLIKCCVMRPLIWDCTVCSCHTKGL